MFSAGMSTRILYRPKTPPPIRATTSIKVRHRPSHGELDTDSSQGSCSTLLDSTLSRSLGQGNAVWIGGIRVRTAIRLGSTPEGARWRRKACGMISRPGRRRSIADVGVRVTPNRRPRGTSSPRPGHWRGTVWPSRRRRLHAIPQAGAWTTREGPATHQPVIRGPSADDQQRRG